MSYRIDARPSFIRPLSPRALCARPVWPSSLPQLEDSCAEVLRATLARLTAHVLVTRLRNSRPSRRRSGGADLRRAALARHGGQRCVLAGAAASADGSGEEDEELRAEQATMRDARPQFLAPAQCR